MPNRIDAFDPVYDEEGVFVCDWEPIADGVRGWMRSNSAIEARAETIDDLYPALATAILEGVGCMMPMIELVPLPPAAPSAAKFLQPELLLINGQFRTDPSLPGSRVGPEAAHYWSKYVDGSMCERCNRTFGPRTVHPLVVHPIPYWFSGAYVFTRRGGHTQLVSSLFLDALHPEERTSLAPRRIDFLEDPDDEGPFPRGEPPVAWFEISGAPLVPFVAIPEAEPAGWTCPACRRSSGIGLHNKGIGGLHYFVAAEDLPDPVPSMFLVGSAEEPGLCVTAKRWAELVGRPATRGVTGKRLGIAPPGSFTREFAFPTRQA